jgi:hypothetical protein
VIGGHSVTAGTWVLILSLALPAVYSAAALQLQQPAPEQAKAMPASAQVEKDTHQSILAEGWQLTPEGAARLESGLASDPQDVTARVRLISYYHQRMIAEPRVRHILWLIENHPEANVFRVAADVSAMRFPDWTGLNTQAGYERAKALWLRQTERYSTDTRILANAVDASVFDADARLRLVRQLRVLEPNNSEWTTWLAAVYARASRDVFFAREPGSGSRSFTARPYLRLGFTTPLPMAEELKTELETSTEAALVGETGELLMSEAALLRTSGYTPEMAASDAFGRSLLKRARALEPANPRWQRQSKQSNLISRFRRKVGVIARFDLNGKSLPRNASSERKKGASRSVKRRYQTLTRCARTT